MCPDFDLKQALLLGFLALGYLAGPVPGRVC